MNTQRHLTTEEKKQILKSALHYKEFACYSFDLYQDFSIRYIATNGITNVKYTYYTAANMDTLNSVLVPIEADICNVIGNMNYTNAYKSFSTNQF